MKGDYKINKKKVRGEKLKNEIAKNYMTRILR